MDFTFEPEYIVAGLIFLLIGISPILMKMRFVNRGELPITKALNEFEVLEGNLIPGTSFDYGYTLGKNNRVVQVRSKQELDELIATIYRRVYYIKENPNEDFVLFGSRENHKEEIKYWKVEEINMEMKSHLKRVYIYPFLVIIFFTLNYFKGEADWQNFMTMVILFIPFWVAPLLLLLGYRAFLKKRL